MSERRPLTLAFLSYWCLRLYGDSGLHLASECLVASDPRIAHGGSELGAEGLLQRPEQCSGNRVIVRRLDPISRVAPPEIAHSRQYLIELMHILDSGLDHCHQ